MIQVPLLSDDEFELVFSLDGTSTFDESLGIFSMESSGLVESSGCLMPLEVGIYDPPPPILE